MVEMKTARKVALLVLLLLFAPSVPLAPTSAEGRPDDCPARTEPLVGRVCDDADGLLRLLDHDDTYSHGVDPADPSDEGRIVAPAIPPVCTTATDTYHARALYTYPTDRASQHATRAAELRTIIERMNGLLLDAAKPFGQRHQYRVLCTDDTIRVDAVALTTPHDATTFSSIVSDLKARGHDLPNAKYIVLHEHDQCTGGVGHRYLDDRLSVDNHNNGNGGATFGVNFGCRGDLGVRITMHEHAHNMGAVQDSAPNSSGTGHCHDGADIMCYDDGSGGYDPTVCGDHQRFDCNHDDYYHPAPPDGSYLATHWNLGSPLNRFLVQEAIRLHADAGPDQRVRDGDGGGTERVTLDGSASDGPRAIVAHAWSRDGTHLADGATPTITLGVGTHTITLTVTDDQGATATDTVRIEVASNGAPTAHAGSALIAHDPDGDGQTRIRLDGSASHDPDGPLTHSWTHDGTTVATGARPTVTLPVGTHTLALTVTDTAGQTDTDTTQVTVRANRPPVAVTPGDQNVEATDTAGTTDVRLDGSASYDPHGRITAFRWSLGGEPVADGPTPTIALPLGTHTLTLRVTDEGGLSDEDTYRITVRPNQPPTARFVATCLERICTLDGITSSDPEDGPLSHRWTFGDGTTKSGAQRVHHYPSAGRYEACLTVTDTHAQSDTTCQTVRVVTLTYSEPFTAGTTPTGWTLSGLWHVTDQCTGTPGGRVHLGYHQRLVSATSLASTCTYQTLERTQGAASFPLDLRDATIATLGFLTRWETEQTQGGTPRDIRTVEVAAKGSTEWVALATWDSRDPNRPQWDTYTYDLTPFVGQETIVRFRFDSVDREANLHSGWAIDDIRIRSDIRPDA